MSLISYMSKSILNEEQLNEAKRLLSTFTFGFELEAATNDPEYGSGYGLPGYGGYHHGSASGDAKKVKEKLDSLLEVDSMQSYIENIEALNDSKQMVELEYWGDKSGVYGYYKDGKVYSEEKPEKKYMLGFVDSDNVYHYREKDEKPGKFPHKGKVKYTDIFYDNKGKVIAHAMTFDKTSYGKNADDIMDISTIEKDGSLTNPERGGWTFEYGSPKIKATYDNMKAYLQFLKSLKHNGFYTYPKCGFHHHFSFDGLDKEMLCWVLFCSANDEETYDMLTKLEINDDQEIPFTHSTYASTNTLDAVKVRNGVIPTVRLSDDKMNVFHIHSRNGTIEWRGPRNFLNYDRDDYIVKFVSQLWKIMLKWANYADSNEFKGFKKEDVVKKITYTDHWESPEEKRLGKKKEDWANMIKNDLSKLITFSPEKLKTVFDAWDISQASNPEQIGSLVKIWSKIPARTKEVIFTKVVQSYSNTLFRAMDQWLKENTNHGLRFSVEDSKLLLKVINAEGRNSEDRSATFNIYVNYMVIDDSKILDEVIKTFGFTKAVVKILRRTGLDKLSKETIKKIINSKDVYIMRYQENIPPQIQRLMIRKNPYNIQYISHPEKSIVDDLRKKYGDSINSYIIGE